MDEISNYWNKADFSAPSLKTVDQQTVIEIINEKAFDAFGITKIQIYSFILF